MIFEQVPSGGDRNFGYLVASPDSKEAAVVDPSPDPNPCFRKVEEFDLEVIYVVNTHSHFDHSAGNALFKQHFNASIVTHESASTGDIRVKDGQNLALGGLKLVFLHTPGHTIDSICVQVNRELITGDTLFVGKVGGTYSVSESRQEFESLKKLMKLDNDIKVWPGHDYGVRPTSTIGEEKKSNPFILRLNNFENFIWLKDNWLNYKIEHNIK
jgi:glyoxylase-like metal-dependent hydrolase (beta-lactamase superfamily II)